MIEEKKEEIGKKEDMVLDKIILLDDETKKEIALNVEETGKLDKLYWIQLFLAAIIATLGLLQNSIPVVIGVMLIAPLLRPIQSFSFGLVSAHNARTINSFKNISLSILLVIVSALLITYMVPVRLETSEVLARTNPNILDFFIAGASAAIAFLALVYKKKLSMSIAGVAMAASLLPPLSVIGIEIAYENYFLAWNSFLLFITNLVAIIFVGIVLFFIFGFKPHQEDDKDKFKKNIILLLFSISLISLPLIVSILNLKLNLEEESFLKNKITEVFLAKDLEIKDLKIENNEEIKNIFIEGLYYNQNEDFSKIKKQLKKIENESQEKFKEKINIELNLFLMKKIKSE